MARIPNIKKIFNFKIDFLDVQGMFYNFESILLGVDFDNSNRVKYQGYTIYLARAPKYDFVVNFIKNDTLCFCWHKGTKFNEIMPPTRDYLRCYGSCFTINSIEDIFTFIITNIDVEKIRRIDLALDLPYNINTVLHKFKKISGKGCDFYGKGGEVETHYIGEYKKSSNKRKLIRIYDKIRDIKAKFNHDLYPDYLVEDNITRIELEIRSELAWSIDFMQILEKDYLFDLFYTYINKETKNLFKYIENDFKLDDKSFEEKKLVNKNKNLDLDNIDYNKLLDSRYLEIFKGYAKNIKRIGACPINILLSEFIYHDDTVTDIGLATNNNKFDVRSYLNDINMRNTKRLLYTNKK